jgi:hypothetical protein
MIPLLAITIFLFSVGLASANMTNTMLETRTSDTGLDAKQLAQAEKKVGTRKGYVGIFTSSTTATTGADVSAALTTGAGFFTLTTEKGDSGVVATSEQEELVIHIPEEGLAAITKMPGRGDAAEISATSAGLDGADVAVLVEFVLDEANNIVAEARKIVVKPTPATPVHGAVESVDTNDEGVSTVTIVSADGTTEEVELGPDVAVPAIGEVVIGFRGRGVGARSAGGREGNGRPVIKGLVRAVAVHDRLQGFLKNLGADRDGLPEIAAEKQELRIERVRAILEKHANRRVVIIERLIGRQNMSPRALEAIADRLENARANREEAKANRERAQAARDEARPVGDGATPGRQDQDRGRRNPR